MSNAVYSQIAEMCLRLDGEDARLDEAAITNGTLFVSRELTQVRNRVYEVKYPELKAMSFIPIATDIDPLFDTYEYYSTDSYGQARIMHKNQRDFPMVSAGTTSHTGKVVTLGLGYNYTLSEIRLAMRLGKPLQDTLAKAARRGHMTSIDELLCTGKLASTGQTADDLGGFINSSLVNKDLILHNWLSTGSTPTSVQIYDDMSRVVANVSVRTKGLFEADTLLMAPELFRVIQDTLMFSSGSETTILQSFLKNHPGVNVAQWAALSSTGDGTIGTSGYHQMIAYPRDPTVVEGVVPLEFEQLPPQMDGLNTDVPCQSRCGGVKFYVPGAVEYAFVNHSIT